MDAIVSGAVTCCALFLTTAAVAEIPSDRLQTMATRLEAKVIAWRRDIHQHPELGNREFRTSALVAEHLQKLGLEVRTAVGYTGVVGVLKGGKSGKVIALRADMDALPVTEETDLPFRSTVTTEYQGKKVGVMHACGHDAHTAILMGVAEALATVRGELPGTVLLIFQPAEEGPPEGEEGGAALMLKEGLFASLKPTAVVGLHMMSGIPSGVIGYRSGPFMAGADTFRIEVRGSQAHGSRPWAGVDPIVVGSQIVIGLQTIVSRQIDITAWPAVVTVGQFDGGVRNNIISDTAQMRGTIRSFDSKMRAEIIERLKRTAEGIASASNAKASVAMSTSPVPVVYNSPSLTEFALDLLKSEYGAERVREIPLQTGAEDFAFYGQHAPSLFFYVGVTPTAMDMKSVPTIHSSRFFMEESAMAVGTRSLLTLAVNLLQTDRDLR